MCELPKMMKWWRIDTYWQHHYPLNFKLKDHKFRLGDTNNSLQQNLSHFLKYGISQFWSCACWKTSGLFEMYWTFLDIILYRSEKERQNYQVNHINHIDYVKGGKFLHHNATTVAKASTKVKKINSMDRHNYQNSYQKSDRYYSTLENHCLFLGFFGLSLQL